MIDPDVETVQPLSKAKIPGNPATCTRWRWALKGVRGQVLETIMVGGTRMTSEQAVGRFLHRLNAPGTLPEPRSAAAQKAGERLAKMGC